MGRRSDFKKIEKDRYFTWDPRAYAQVEHIFRRIGSYVEPCAGGGDMMQKLTELGLDCLMASDIEPTKPKHQGLRRIRAKDYVEPEVWEAATAADCIITNPPWTREHLHPFISWCVATGTPAWLLIDSNWAMTKQARPYLKHCSHIIPTARLKWIEDTTDSAKDDTAWYRFQTEPCPTILLNQDKPDPGFLPEFTRRDDRPMLHELI